MMVQLGASTGLMGKIPGFKQFSQMKKLANMDINALMAAGGGLPPAPREGAGQAHPPAGQQARRRPAPRQRQAEGARQAQGREGRAQEEPPVARGPALSC